MGKETVKVDGLILLCDRGAECDLSTGCPVPLPRSLETYEENMIDIGK